MIVKVKEPQPRGGRAAARRHTLFTYLHLAPDPELTQGLMERRDLRRLRDGHRQARAAAAAGADERGRRQDRRRRRAPSCSRSRSAAAGILLGGVPGVAAGKVMVIGGGVVGMNAARDRGRHGRRRLRLRPQHRLACATSTSIFAGQLLDVLARRWRSSERCASGPRHRRGAHPRRQGSARDPREQLVRCMKPRRRARRRRRRPGRLLRDLAPDHARRPDLRGRRHHPLLRGEHAGRRAAHLDLRADQRDAALRAATRRRGHRPGRPRRTRRSREGVNVVAGAYRPVAEATGKPHRELFEALGSGRPRSRRSALELISRRAVAGFPAASVALTVTTTLTLRPFRTAAAAARGSLSLNDFRATVARLVIAGRIVPFALPPRSRPETRTWHGSPQRTPTRTRFFWRAMRWRLRPLSAGVGGGASPGAAGSGAGVGTGVGTGATGAGVTGRHRASQAVQASASAPPRSWSSGTAR